jgi:hypothetical protein
VRRPFGATASQGRRLALHWLDSGQDDVASCFRSLRARPALHAGSGAGDLLSSGGTPQDPNDVTNKADLDLRLDFGAAIERKRGRMRRRQFQP